MPCHSGPTVLPREEREKAIIEKLEDLNHRASLGADLLREYILGNVAVQRIMPILNQQFSKEFLDLYRDADFKLLPQSAVDAVDELISEYEDMNELVTIIGKDTLDADSKAVIEKRQIQHRNEDLMRLMKTFAASGDKDRLRIVLDADPKKPLAAQLGFDPDEF